jgi:hypothetical protein
MAESKWVRTNSGWSYRSELVKPYTFATAMITIRKDKFIARIPKHNLVLTFEDADKAKQWVEVTTRIMGD